MSTTIKVTAILIIIAAAINIFLLSNNSIKRSSFTPSQPISEIAPSVVPNNVTVVEDKQVITLTAKGGYSPKITTAKADMPTVIKMVTKGTFDCSSSLSIPKIAYQSNLLPTGETLIDVPAQPKGTVLEGVCSMGMYNFSIKFE